MALCFQKNRQCSKTWRRISLPSRFPSPICVNCAMKDANGYDKEVWQQIVELGFASILIPKSKAAQALARWVLVLS